MRGARPEIWGRSEAVTFMTGTSDVLVLTVNTGSSSLKVALYAMGTHERVLLSADADRIGRSESRFRLADGDGRVLSDERQPLPDHDTALRALCTAMERQGSTPDAIRHRVVYEGSAYSRLHIVKWLACSEEHRSGKVLQDTPIIARTR